MARHNEVTLYGRVIQNPKLFYNSTDETNPSRTLLRVIGAISVVRGIRDFGAVDKRIRIDVPIVLSQNKKIMKLMKTWEVGDMILIRGTLATVNVTKSICCPNCQQIEPVKTTLAFINPIFMKTECKGLSPEEGNQDMRQNAEISNRITVIGKACTAPELFVTDKGQKITNYQLDIMRKYRIKEDDEENKHDFPFVKSYGYVQTMIIGRSRKEVWYLLMEPSKHVNIPGHMYVHSARRNTYIGILQQKSFRILQNI